MSEPAARRAYLDRVMRELDELRNVAASEEYGKARGSGPFADRIDQDIMHWEAGVRAELRKSFPAGTDAAFDAEDQPTDNSQQALLDYFDRLRHRVEEIRRGT